MPRHLSETLTIPAPTRSYRAVRTSSAASRGATASCRSGPWGLKVAIAGDSINYDALAANGWWWVGFPDLMGAVGNRCTLLVTVTPTAGALANEIKAGKQARADAHPNVHVVPWARVW